MANRYEQIIARIFQDRFIEGAQRVEFTRKDFIHVTHDLGISIPSNLGDVLYSFRFRVDLPKEVRETAPPGKVWVLEIIGRARYAFVLIDDVPIVPSPHISETKVPDATPGIVAKYTGEDEQALLAKVRY